jgi:hypothetical protein
VARVVRVPHAEYQAKKPWDEFIISTAFSLLSELHCAVWCHARRFVHPLE